MKKIDLLLETINALMLLHERELNVLFKYNESELNDHLTFYLLLLESGKK